MIKVLLIYKFLVELGGKKDVEALNTSFVRCQDIVESLVTILDYVWLILYNIIAVFIIHEINHLESIFTILFVFSSCNKELEALYFIFGIDVRNGSMEAVSKEIMLSFVGYELISSKLLYLSSLKSGLDISDSSLSVAKSVVDLHAFQNEPAKLILDGKSEMVSRFLLFHWHIISFGLCVWEPFSLMSGHHIWRSCKWYMSWMEVLLVLGRHITRAALNDLLCLNTENAENYILDLVIWIVLHISIRLARKRNEWEEI